MKIDILEKSGKKIKLQLSIPETAPNRASASFWPPVRIEKELKIFLEKEGVQEYKITSTLEVMLNKLPGQLRQQIVDVEIPKIKPAKAKPKSSKKKLKSES